MAASLLRGIRFIQIPTSLLAQVDSSVGGKTGINSAHGKNLVGAFHQPSLVLADIDLLASLPERELRAGYAEIVKYGLLGDADFFEWLESNGTALLSGTPDILAEAVGRSCQAKADIVAEDEKEQGRRALLNLGHTFAHAFEAEAGYDGRLLHGEAVAVGLRCAFEFSEQLGFASGQDTRRIIAHLRTAGLLSSVHDMPAGWASPDRLISHMYKDKGTVWFAYFYPCPPDRRGLCCTKYCRSRYQTLSRAIMMDLLSAGIIICVIILLICLSAFFSSAETALTAASDARIASLHAKAANVPR